MNFAGLRNVSTRRTVLDCLVHLQNRFGVGIDGQ